MEAAVAGVGKALLNCLLSGAKAAIDQDVATRQGIQRGLPFLTDELAEMQSFLSDADVERNKDKVTRSRVKYIRDLAYEVEDCLQDYIVHSEKPSWWRIPRARLEQHRIAEEMKGLRGRVEDMAERKSRYRLVEGSSYGPERPIIVNPEIFGIEQARRVAMMQQQQGRGVMDQQDRAKMGQQDKAIIDLTQLVKKGDRDLRVVAVWGSSDDLGVGQASIIEGAYANLKKNKMFQCHARIRVMHPLNVTELLQTIIRQFYVNSLQHSLRTQEDDTLRTQILHSMGTMKEDGLADVFKNYLNEKRYLIVLDDLCTIEDWDRIKSCFPNNNTRSRIMLSTEQVEAIGANSIAVDHKHLSSDRNVYAFYKKDSEDVTNLMETDSSSNAANAGSNISDDRKILHQRTIQLIGREREQSDIINLITNENQHLEVISVWGMGGIGKTTLVRAVYQNQELMGQFEKRACVTAMHPFNCGELLRSVALQFGYEDAIDLRRKLGKNKYLIVFYDIASTAEWDSIVPYFPATDTASRIILTTREENIAKHCSEKHENIYQLRSLGYRDAHDLFTKTVFVLNIEMDEQYPELIDSTNLILMKCSGLPLTIVTIGRFLADRPKTSEEWTKLNEHLSDALSTDPTHETIIEVLIRSYDGLPYHLKCCFLYLSIFPEGYIIRQRWLVRRWIAEGYIKEVRGKSAEEIAENYFTELITRFMILPSNVRFY